MLLRKLRKLCCTLWNTFRWILIVDYNHTAGYRSNAWTVYSQRRARDEIINGVRWIGVRYKGKYKTSNFEIRLKVHLIEGTRSIRGPHYRGFTVSLSLSIALKDYEHVVLCNLPLFDTKQKAFAVKHGLKSWRYNTSKLGDTWTDTTKKCLT